MIKKDESFRITGNAQHDKNRVTLRGAHPVGFNPGHYTRDNTVQDRCIESHRFCSAVQGKATYPMKESDGVGFPHTTPGWVFKHFVTRLPQDIDEENFGLMKLWGMSFDQNPFNLMVRRRCTRRWNKTLSLDSCEIWNRNGNRRACLVDFYLVTMDVMPRRLSTMEREAYEKKSEPSNSKTDNYD